MEQCLCDSFVMDKFMGVCGDRIGTLYGEQVADFRNIGSEAI